MIWILNLSPSIPLLVTLTFTAPCCVRKLVWLYGLLCAPDGLTTPVGPFLKTTVLNSLYCVVTYVVVPGSKPASYPRSKLSKISLYIRRYSSSSDNILNSVFVSSASSLCSTYSSTPNTLYETTLSRYMLVYSWYAWSCALWTISCISLSSASSGFPWIICCPYASCWNALADCPLLKVMDVPLVLSKFNVK